MTRLALSIKKIKSHYPWWLSAPGMAAPSRPPVWTRAGQQVCLLERGKEFQPGEYAKTEAEALAEMQSDKSIHGQIPKKAGTEDALEVYFNE